MEIKEITDLNFKDEWNQFVGENSSPASFLQSWKWGKFRSQEFGEKILRLAVYENNELMSVAQFFQLALPLGRFYLFCPRGPVISKQVTSDKWQEIINLIISEIKKISKQEKNVFVRFELPDTMGFLLVPIDIGTRDGLFKIPKILIHSKNPENTLILDLSKSEEEILSAMHQKTRYNIRLAEKKGVKVKWQMENKNNNINKFYNLLQETAKRDKIKIFSKSYYEKLLNYFYYHSCESRNPKKNMDPDFCQDDKEIILDDKTKNKNYNIKIALFFAEYQNKPLASIIVLGFGNTATYLHGGSSNENREVMPNYAIQWAAIKWAKEHGYLWYDFWGINNETKNGAWAGITRFKQGFVSKNTGKKINYQGAIDYILDKKWYNILMLGKILKFN